MRRPLLSAASRAVGGAAGRRWRRGALVLLTAFAAPSRAGDAARGAAIFSTECSGCHSVEAGRVIVGPPLAGVLGRAAGSVAGFDYSPAMRASGLVWDAATLDRYLKSPAGTVPGIRMPYPGLRDTARRDDLIAFLSIPH